MPQNIELTDTGIVELESLLNAYRRRTEEGDDEVLNTLVSRCGEVMSKAHHGGEPLEPQSHMYYTDSAAEDKMLADVLEWAVEERQDNLAKQILRQLD